MNGCWCIRGKCLCFLFATGSMKDGGFITLYSEVYSHSNHCAFTLSKTSYTLIDQRQSNLIRKSNLNQCCSLSSPQLSEIQCISKCIIYWRSDFKRREVFQVEPISSTNMWCVCVCVLIFNHYSYFFIYFLFFCDQLFVFRRKIKSTQTNRQGRGRNRHIIKIKINKSLYSLSLI